jgi:diguanylate cyclase
MASLEQLTEVIIEALKGFSNNKRQLTVADLCEVLSRTEEFRYLFPCEKSEISGNGNGIALAAQEAYAILEDSPKASIDSVRKSLDKTRAVLLRILDRLGPLVRNDYEHQFCELRKKLDECRSFESLEELGDKLDSLVAALIGEALETVDFSNDYLVELSKDLYKMEEQLSACRSHNRETHRLNSDFNSNLLQHADEMNRAFESPCSLEDVRTQVISRIGAISMAVEVKQQEDELRIREADSKIVELQSSLKIYGQEIIQIRERADCLEKEILLDDLTQVANRRGYDLQIRESLRRYRRNAEPFSLILIDIDHFKTVNDSYGHKIGDNCLREVAQLIRSTIRQSDFLARYGGEELVVILAGTYARNAREVAEKIRSCIEKTRFHIQEESISLTVSLGVTEAAPSDLDPEIPFIRADEAMYRAKRDGRNRVRVITDLSQEKQEPSTRPAGESLEA